MVTVKKILFKANGRVHIHLSNGEKILTFDDLLVKNPLSVDQELDERQLQQLEYEVQIIGCRNKALRLLGRRAHSAREIKTKLYQSGKFPGDVIAGAVDELIEKGYIDDLEFARAFIRDRILLRPDLGRSRTINDLCKKGIPRHTAKQLFEDAELDPEEELARAEKTAAKKWKTYKGQDFYKDKARLARFLTGRGFPGHIISTILKKLKKDNEDENPFSNE